MDPVGPLGPDVEGTTAITEDHLGFPSGAPFRHPQVGLLDQVLHPHLHLPMVPLEHPLEDPGEEPAAEATPEPSGSMP